MPLAVSINTILFLADSAKLTGLDTCTALDALGFIYHMRLLYSAGDAVHWALPGAGGTALALVWIDLEGEQVLADACRATLLLDVSLILISEELQSGEHRVWCSLAQAAQGVGLYVVAQFLQLVQILHCGLAVCDLLQYLQHTPCTYTAWGTLTAGLVHGE